MSVLDRYIIKEWIPPFLLSVGVLLFLLLAQQMLLMIEFVVERGAGTISILKFIAHLLPSFLVLSLPIAVLIASVSAFNRFSGDRETIAFRSAGISLYRLLRPVFTLSLLVCLVVFVLSVVVKPWTGFSMKNLAIDMLERDGSVVLKEGQFNNLFKGMVIYAEKVSESNQMKGIFIQDRRHPEAPHLIVAKQGRLQVDPASGNLLLHLAGGSLHQKSVDSQQYQLITFSSYDLRFNFQSLLNRSPRLNQEQLTAEVIRENLTASGGTDPRWLLRLQEHYRNYALPLSSLLLGILGVSLGIHTRRAGRMGGFATGISIVGIYYLLLISGDFLTTTRMLSPLTAAWFPNLVLGLVTVLFTLHTAREGRWNRPSPKPSP